MRITPRILGLAMPLLLIGCADWGPNKKATRSVTLYADVGHAIKGTIPMGTICRIDQKLSGGKIYNFRKIECQDGQSGYLMIVSGDELAFESTH